MSLTIWHELDTPRIPLNDYEKDTLISLAKIGKKATRPTGFRGYNAFIFDQLDQLEQATRTFDPDASASIHYLGRVIGVRAGMYGLAVEDEADTGFRLSGRGMSHLREAKILGTHAANNPGSVYFPDLISSYLRNFGESSSFMNEDVMGYAIGIRQVELEGVTV